MGRYLGSCIDCIYCKELHYERDCVDTDVSHVCIVEVTDVTEKGIVFAPTDARNYRCPDYKER